MCMLHYRHVLNNVTWELYVYEACVLSAVSTLSWLIANISYFSVINLKYKDNLSPTGKWGYTAFPGYTSVPLKVFLSRPSWCKKKSQTHFGMHQIYKVISNFHVVYLHEILTIDNLIDISNEMTWPKITILSEHEFAQCIKAWRKRACTALMLCSFKTYILF